MMINRLPRRSHRRRTRPRRFRPCDRPLRRGRRAAARGSTSAASGAARSGRGAAAHGGGSAVHRPRRRLVSGVAVHNCFMVQICQDYLVKLPFVGGGWLSTHFHVGIN